jgi:chromosomal replication initiation ATPase DnaA
MRTSVLKKTLSMVADPSRRTFERSLGSIDLLGNLSPEERLAAACDGTIDIAAALFGVSGRELRHPGRSTVDVSRVRQVAMYVAHVALGLSMRDVGQGFGRDRTTVLHACHLIEDLRDDAEFDGMVATMERIVTVAFGRREA